MIDDVFFDSIEFCKDSVRPKNVHEHVLQRDIGLHIHGWEKQGRGEKLKDVQQIELETLTSNFDVLTCHVMKPCDMKTPKLVGTRQLLT